MKYSSLKQILKNLYVGLKAVATGQNEHSFYFQTMNLTDSIKAIKYSLMNIVGVRVNRNSRERFLGEVKRLFNYRAAFLFGSGRSAIYSLLSSMELSKESEVIVTGYTCDVVPNAVIQAGLNPVYVDIDPAHYCMSPTSVLSKITDQTKVIILQHSYGLTTDVEAILKFAHDHSLYVIEDCAVSLGSKHSGKLTGSFGDAAIFSFELSKTITSGRGGMLLLNTDSMNSISKVTEYYNKNVPEQKYLYRIKTLFQLGASGFLYRPRIMPAGKFIIALMFKLKIFSYSTSLDEKLGRMPADYICKLSSEQAKILTRQWQRLPQILGISRTNIDWYLKKLRNHISPEQFKKLSNPEVNLIRFPIQISKRAEFLQNHEAFPVEIGQWFTAPISDTDTDQLAFQYEIGYCPVSEKVCSEIINLPLNIELNEDVRNRIILGIINYV